MIKFYVYINGNKIDFRSLFFGCKNYCYSSRPDIQRLFRWELTNTHKCSEEEAQWLEDEFRKIVYWKDAHRRDEFDVSLFDNLHDRGYIKDSDYELLAAKCGASTFVPRCPVCGSPDLKTIGTGTRLFHQGMFGLAGSKSLAQRECRNCGYKF